MAIFNWLVTFNNKSILVLLLC